MSISCATSRRENAGPPRKVPSRAAGDARAEAEQLVDVQVRHQRVAQLALAPDRDPEAALLTNGDRVAAEVVAGCRKREPVGAKDEERRRVRAPLVDQHGGLSVEVVADRSPLQRELVVTA